MSSFVTTRISGRSSRRRAPLVPYTEYLLYRQEGKDIALQNIGGMGNITFLPRDGSLAELTAFDTGPGNVLIDAAVERLSEGKLRYDEGGALAAKYPVSEELLDILLDDPYLRQKPPKTTGREKYGQTFLRELYRRAGALSLSDGEVLATGANQFTKSSYCFMVSSSTCWGVRSPIYMDWIFLSR